MWVTNLAALVLLAISASAATSASKDKVLSNHATILADNSVTLAFSLYQNMAKEKDLENILISPVVVASALGLVALGGKASTASQVKTILNAAKVKDEQLHSGLAELLTEVSDPKTRNVTWKISNRLYGPSSVSFVDEFVKSSKKHYKFDHSKINFRDKKSAVNSINEWAAKSTDGKLSEVTKDVEKTDGAMIITAMFFKRESVWSLFISSVLFFQMKLKWRKLYFCVQLAGMSSSIIRWWTTVDSWYPEATRFQYRWCTAQVGGHSPVDSSRNKIIKNNIDICNNRNKSTNLQIMQKL